MISHFSPVDLANIPLPPVPALPPLPPVAAASSAVADADEANYVSVAVRDNLNDEVQHAVAWGELDAHFSRRRGCRTSPTTSITKIKRRASMTSRRCGVDLLQ